MRKTKPLVLDVDGTFLRTDMLFECLWGGLGRDPIATVRAIWDTFGDKAALKAQLADIAKPRVDLMPVSAPAAAMVDAAKAQKVEVVLASASDISLVRDLAAVHDLSPTVFASENGNNLRGAAKADALVAAYGEGGFHYAGNEPGDMAIWEKADEAIIVGPVPGAKPRSSPNITSPSYRAAGHGLI